MSAGYATKLSYRDDLGGQLGDPEISDAPTEVLQKVNKLLEWVRQSSKIVVFTGAGISTACGIPDFRGPSGIWTLQRAHRPIPPFKVSFGVAKPSLCHQALVALLHTGKLQHIVSQNVDGLHLRSGIPRSQLAELHGNCFAERCTKCKREYIRDFEMETVGFKFTGRRCVAEGCNGRLKDHVLDWEDALPEDELEASEKASAEADLAICLGTSLQITPACDIPLKTVMTGGKLVIINLQKTPKDKKASLVIHARCDEVMQQLMSQMQLPIPSYTRQDSVLVTHALKKGRVLQDGVQSINCTLRVQSTHGQKCPLPLVQQVDMDFQDAKARPAVLRKQPFVVVRSILAAQATTVSIKLLLSDVIDEAYRVHVFQHDVPVELAPRDTFQDQAMSRQQVYTFTTQVATNASTSGVMAPAQTTAVSAQPSSCSETEPPGHQAKRAKVDAERL